ncbi:MAG: hypothetical protein K2Q20_01585 [Phycisphaerales bacterium]|nr:hypothetical protein [Phycisphaerales bacterium]
MSRWLYTFAVVSADRLVPAFVGDDAAMRAEDWLRQVVAEDQAALAMYATFLDGWHCLPSLIGWMLAGDERLMETLGRAEAHGVAELPVRSFAGCRLAVPPELNDEEVGAEEVRLFVSLVNHWVTMAHVTGSSALLAARALGPSLEDREFRPRD